MRNQRLRSKNKIVAEFKLEFKKSSFWFSFFSHIFIFLHIVSLVWLKKSMDQTVEGLDYQAWDVHFMSTIEYHWRFWEKEWHDQSSVQKNQCGQEMCGWWNAWEELEFGRSIRELLQSSGKDEMKAWSQCGDSGDIKGNNGFSISGRKTAG